ncbi:sugar ABC transporter ATP-binding protein [Parasphaerochaeta coccoides]|uniref:Monosaccharide-transporting ATPase n=1 Tax=Parasphaerochaeta coccoides (strain ATCC BAA-1237 / DSM 17374 / SPN1) TaxID=760011 RepID=F4GKH3_PARC1|nr:sugar ABC transporter ATP-binding protein [Parasphaerochaeta coccoides]AEC02856.1 Monosaccharide-transporting ATPase [Parasphaerochaeta coccoides DSM 17374]
MSQVILEVRHLMKFFPGIKALDDVHMDVRAGEIHALIGENGAGKSTLVKILTGVYTPTSGSVILEGKEMKFSNALDAQQAGIVAIHQEASMFPELSVTENIYMGHHLYSPHSRRLDWKAMHKETRKLLDSLQLDIAPDTLVKNLGIAQRHMVEIAKALSLDAKVVIMDEPTSALTSREVEDLYRIVRKLKEEGKSIIFISHKFEEIFEICDTYTVLRDGRYIGSGYLKDTDRDSIIRMMIGRSVDQMFPKKELVVGKPLLEVKELCQTGNFTNVSFTLHEGEILGFFGLVGAGRSEVMRAIFGIDPCSSGSIMMDGEIFSPSSPGVAMARGIALVPEDRQKQGLILAMSISRNIALPCLASLSRHGVVNRKKAAAYAEKYGSQMEIRAAGWHVDADTLSGGNQQKVVLSKWIGTQPRILIMDEPTKGIDVATKAAVHEFVSEMASQGMGVILVSSELPEVLGMSDRIVVMHEGEVTAVLDRADAGSENVMAAAIGEVQEAVR